MTVHSADSSTDDLILSRHQVERLLETELPRYANAILNGTALRRLPNVAALYAIANSGNWTSILRNSLTEQLKQKDAITTFACLVLPPGFGTTKSHLDEIFNVEEVLDFIAQQPHDFVWNTDPWVRECFLRFKAILDGSDTTFGR
ncbi:MAG: hypothetical protein V7660_02355 [Hyphomonas sp.]